MNNEGDERGINNDEDLNNNLGEAKEFYVYKNETKVDPIKPTDIEINIDIKDKDIEDIIDSQIKKIEIDDKLNDVIEFDKDKYKYKDNFKKKN